MSKVTTLAALKKGMNDFKLNFIAALSIAATRAKYADDSDKLANKSPDEVMALLQAEVAKHTNNKGHNVHNLKAGQIGSYDKVEYDDSLDKFLDVDSDIPLSFYGDREYLPPGITGSFESGSAASPYNNVALILEDNGTLVMIRSGTDGDSSGLYYSYMRNAESETDYSNQIVTTNTRYQPAFFPTDRRGYCILNATQDVIIGRLVNKSDGKFNGYFMSLTNNTFDQTKHTGIIIPENGIFNVYIDGTATANAPTAYIKGGYVYILINLLSSAASTLSYRVYRIPLANLISGTYVAPTRITGWSINRGAAGIVVKDDIELFTNIRDVFNLSGNAMDVVKSQANGSGGQTVHVSSDGRVFFTASPWMQINASNQLIQNLGFYVGIHFEITDSKLIDVSKYHNEKIGVYYDNKAFRFSSGAAFRIPVNDKPITESRVEKNWYGVLGGQANIALYTTRFNQMWMFDTTTYFTGRTLTKVTFPEGITYSQAMTGDVYPKAMNRQGFTSKYGSPLSQSFSQHGAIGNNVLLCRNINSRNGSTANMSVKSVFTGDPTYQYSSITGKYVRKGFKPSTDRKYFLDLNATEELNSTGLNEGDSSNTGYVSQARFNGGLSETRVRQIREDLSTSGTVTCSKAVQATVKSQIVSSLSAKGYNLYNNASKSCGVEINVPQMYTDMPAFAVFMFIRDNRTAWIGCCTLNISGSRQNVTNATINSDSMDIINIPIAEASGLEVAYVAEVGQSAIRRVAGGFALGLLPGLLCVLQGDSETFLVGLNYTTATGKLAFVGTGVWNYQFAAPGGWVNLPNRGLYMTISSEFLRGDIDGGTKMLGVLACTTQPMTLDVGNALFSKYQDPNESIVMLSQKIDSAWTIYFADVTPVMMRGLYTLMQPFVYELTPGTDANKRFYLWVVRNGKTIKYQLSTSTAAPAGDDVLYLGYVSTTVEGIQQIVTEKRVAVGGCVLAREAQGSAIPLTSGTPNNPGKLNWK